ncbi:MULTISPECIES: helix-turn-helix transcriptional regulator [unclassified Shinella]|uniref:helix-turn-helix domain-containing protein n=1 Tax=unclassified Shinella TaxID=2643062 RepID=UPI00225CADDC|nr:MULTISPECIES: helix-turn-helix transcriptional regulator [unclassified Shinella]MCO5139038.1 helix-turn-helix domain-containing protein [Shinella sp.]MDC7256233.1 helix-turn-helix domain-containing protein [Shinella sp. YE25]CAI0339091.1 XRE family transcriptional regulator [Rhizobiaceae bacterium]CAK7257507.1 XRE family transcriptional regulator [Shinella sp. WSC3-e]
MGTFDYDAVFRRILSKNSWGTEGELAKKLGVAPNTWTAYKKGKTSFGLHEIAKICDTLGVAPRWLLLGEDEKGQASLYDRVERIVLEEHLAAKIKLPATALAKTASYYLAGLEERLISKDDCEEVDLRLRLLHKEVRIAIENARSEPGKGKHSA